MEKINIAEQIGASFAPPSYNEVELTMEETETAIEEGKRLAREAKYFRLQREAYQRKISMPEKYISHTAEQLFEMFSASHKIIDTLHEKKIKQLCCYFAKDKRFSGDLDRGLLLLGQPGTGKTEAMRFFSANQNHSFRLEAMLDLAFDYKMGGEKSISQYNINFKASPNMYGLTDYGYCFDDLGTEEIPSRHFAESKNIFSEIVQCRYHNQLPFNSTHAISNMPLKSLEAVHTSLQEMYGSRCYSRMKEMMNVIVFDNESFR